MVIGLVDIYEKLKELITLSETVRENTEEIKELKKELGESKRQIQNQNEYELKVDAQVEKFLDIKEKFTYFLITASAVIIGFLADFTVKYRNEVGNLVWLVIISSIAGLLASGFSLLNLYFGLKSYSLHIKYRYQHKNWDSLKDKEKEEWDYINLWRDRFLKYAFLCLFFEIAFAITFFIYFFNIQTPSLSANISSNI